MYKARLFFRDEPRIITQARLKDIRDQILAEALRHHKQPLSIYWALMEVPEGVSMDASYSNLYNQLNTIQGLTPSQKWLQQESEEMAYSYGLIGHYKACKDAQKDPWKPLRAWAPSVKRILDIALEDNQ